MATTSVVDAFVVTLGLDASKFKQGTLNLKVDLHNTVQNAQTAAKDIEAAGKRASEFFTRMRNQAIAMFAIFTAGRGIKDFVRDITVSDAAVSRLAYAIGLSTKELATWQKAAVTLGGTAEGIAGAFSAMSAAFTEQSLTGKGAENYLAIFQQLGVAAYDATGKLRPYAEIMADIAKRSVELDRVDPQRTNFLLGQLGLGKDDITVLRNPNLRRTLGEAQERGVPSQADADRAIGLMKGVQNLKDDIEGIARRILNGISQPLIDMMDRFDKWLRSADTGDKIDKFIDMLRDFIKYLTEDVDWPAIMQRFTDFSNNVLHLDQGFAGLKRSSEELFATWSGPAMQAAMTAMGLLLLRLAYIPGSGVTAAGLAVLGIAAAANKLGKSETGRSLATPGGYETPWSNPGRMKSSDEEDAGPQRPGLGQRAWGWWLDFTGRGNGGRSNFRGTTAQQDKTGQGAIDFYTSKGYSAEAAAGFAAQEIAESGGNPHARGDGGLAHGAYQWHPDRRANILKGTGIDVSSDKTTIEQQREAFLWELRNTEAKGAGFTARARTAAEAGAAATSILRPADRAGEEVKRGGIAERLLWQYRHRTDTTDPIPGRLLPGADVRSGAGAAAPAVPVAPAGSGGGDSTTVTTGPIAIHTKATDAAGIARDMKQAINNVMRGGLANRGLA